jgi:TLD
MRHSRREKCHSIIDQAHMESEIDVYPFIGVNNCIQLCTHDKIAVGGGTYVSSPGFPESDLAGDVNEVQDRYKAHEWGFGLTIESDFLHGTTSPCLTFGSPSLSTMHSDGSLFEIMNIELWSLTPCTRLEDAEKLELGKLFLEAHTKS